ncbi:MAG TPA: hypothetical protein VJ696_01545, partial [Rhodanobacteraceae bacterium]|nr:hypothetical protein [Rhodanobacteraceae bacterium]
RDASKTVKDDNPETVTVTGTRVRRLDFVDHYSESTIVQTGAGEPRWQRGQRYVLGWSGPVLPNQDVRLVIAPPWLVRALRVVLVALLAWLVVRLILPALRMPPRATAAAFVVLASAGFCASSPARAQAFPPEGLLDELRSRIAEAPKCAPECAAIESATATASGDEISVALVAHAVDRVALPLPIDERTLALRSVAIDGAQQDAFARADGEIWIAISRGVHRVELAYTAAADKVALAFPLKPMHVAFSGTGWEASGIGDGQLLTETLTLARARAEGAMPATSGAQQFAPFVRVERFLNLGLDWTAETRAHRLAPEDGGFAVAIPVLAGEHVLTPGTKIENGRATIAIADGEDSAAWSSRLDKSDALTLTAPPLADRAEVWRVVVSPTWHVEFDGVPPVAMTPDEDAQDYRNFEFHPLPGETLTLRIARPAAAEGSTRAIDSVRLVETVGQRASTATLSLSMRASQGGEEIVTLPPGLEIVGARRNGEALNLRARDGKLVLPVVPGTQSFEIDLRDATPAGFVARTPSIGLGSPAANIDLALELAGDRWLLAARGPAAGPAVLYWSELAVMLLVAWALARTRRTPLKLRQWVLLGIGFSTFSWLALIVVVAWLFAIEWRARWPQPRSALAFDFAQIGLVLLTLVALLCLVAAVPQGLLGSPDMHVAGNNSYGGSLHWFADRSMGSLPQASAISVPLWIYKLLMLAWALWLANAVVGWLRRGFAAWLQGGHWRALRQAPAVDIPAAVAPPAAAP